ncbi:pectin lyase-like superfamily protein [Actinidia rufa]|uniref:Pectate lyase n=1 Tax=Actinidia rufa TaxID=165716 RepID=A0A7J0FUM8_9ERIC|nr:pectin lyase-like superfamily protein [Actinidia rufa]
MLSYTTNDQTTTCETGNPIDDCWRCNPNWQLNRQRLADCGIGFGQYAIGGKGGRFYVVTDSSDNDAVNPRPGTLRYAVIQTEPLWIVFSANVHIRLSQVTIAFNHFGQKLVQRMPRCRRGYIHVVNNDFTQWEMYAIGGSGNPTINSQGNRYIAPFNGNAKEVTKRVETGEEEWREWNWRSEGDVMVNGAYFVASGAGVEVKYEKAYSVEPKSASFIDQLTMNAGVLGGRTNKQSKWTDGNNSVVGGGGMVLESGDDEDNSNYMFWSSAPSPPISNSILFPVLTSLSSFLFLYVTTSSALL